MCWFWKVPLSIKAEGLSSEVGSVHVVLRNAPLELQYTHTFFIYYFNETAVKSIINKCVKLEIMLENTKLQTPLSKRSLYAVLTTYQSTLEEWIMNANLQFSFSC